MDLAGTARRGVLFENGDFDAEEFAELEGFLSAEHIGLGVIFAFLVDDLATANLTRSAWGLKAAFDFRAEWDDVIFPTKLFDVFVFLASSIEAARGA